MNQPSAISGSQNSYSTLENFPALYQLADEINEVDKKFSEELRSGQQKQISKQNQLIIKQEELNISEFLQNSTYQKSPNYTFYPNEKLNLPQFQQQQQNEEKKQSDYKKDRLMFFNNQADTQFNNDSNNSEFEKDIQHVSLNLEESSELINIEEKKAEQRIDRKKKLNINSNCFISQNQFENFEFQLEQNQKKYQFEEKKQQWQSEFQISNPSHQAKIESLSCEQFRDIYLSEQQQQKQQFNFTEPFLPHCQQQQQFQSQTQNYIPTANQLSWDLQQQQQQQQLQQRQPQQQFISCSCQSLKKFSKPQDQIIVQTIRNPFILEISSKVYTGFLKYFDPDKQYGFIVIDGENRELFFHFQDVTHYLLTLDFLNSVKDGRKIKLSFNICQYRGKQSSIRKKAVNLAPFT